MERTGHRISAGIIMDNTFTKRPCGKSEERLHKRRLPRETGIFPLFKALFFKDSKPGSVQTAEEIWKSCFQHNILN